MTGILGPRVSRRCFDRVAHRLESTCIDDLFRVLMGDQVEPRREFIQKHALDVRNLDV